MFEEDFYADEPDAFTDEIFFVDAPDDFEDFEPEDEDYGDGAWRDEDDYYDGPDEDYEDSHDDRFDSLIYDPPNLP